MALRRARLLATGALLALVSPLLSSGQMASAAEPVDCSDLSANLLQRVKPTTQANLVTLWAIEAEIANERFGFTEDAGVLARVATTDGPGLSAVWRLYKSGDFVWATDGPDLEDFVAAGYARQFVGFYAPDEATGCVEPVYQLERDGKHRLATNSKRDALVRDGWTLQGTSFYAAPAADGITPPPGDRDEDDSIFSLAVIPDTQNEVLSATSPRFRNRATWLANQKSALDLRYAFQVGDLVNWGHVAPEQFTKASTDIEPLEAAMPWAGAIGNHDTAAVCVGGSACPGANTPVTVRDTSAYNRTFPVSRFDNLRGTFEPGKVDNAYHSFTAGGVDWLVLTLELYPRPSAVSWARSVVAGHPGHNVIMVTHHYLQPDGSIGQSNGGYGATSPQYLFDNLIKVYPNIKLVFSSHVGDSAVRTDVGADGNRVVSLLQHFHSSTNPVRLVEIDTEAGIVKSKVYAPYTNTAYPQYDTMTSGVNFVE